MIGSPATVPSQDDDATGDERIAGSLGLRLVAGLALVAAGELALCALVPRDLIPDRAGLAASALVSLGGLLVGCALARRNQVIPPGGFALLVLIACAKVALGMVHWSFFYERVTQEPTAYFEFSPAYEERQADVLCIVEIMDVWDRTGIHYVSEDEEYISINNRPPAHMAALVVRAFGRRLDAYFPFVAMLTAFASLASMAAIKATRMTRERRRAAMVLALLWPIGAHVGSVTKDITFFAVIAMCSSSLLLAQAARRTPWPGLVAAAVTIPLFRPVYLAAVGLTAVIASLQARMNPFLRILLLLGSVAFGVAALTGAVFTEKLEAYSDFERMTSSVTDKFPVLGRVAFGLLTPFPWTQAFSEPLNYYMFFFFPQQVVTVALALALASALSKGAVRKRPDSGFVLGVLIISIGMAAPIPHPTYVQVGVMATLPFIAATSPSGLGRYIAMSAALLVGANLVWISVR